MTGTDFLRNARGNDVGDTNYDKLPFYMKFSLNKGEDKDVIFLTEEGEHVGIPQHSVKVGKYFKDVTCMSALEAPCPLCQIAESNPAVKRAAGVRVYTVLDMTPRKDKEGKPVLDKETGKPIMYSRRFLILKPRAAAKLDSKLARLREKKKLTGSLVGAKFTIARSTDEMAPRSGDDFDFVDMADLSQFPADDVEELDYGRYFEPSAAALKILCANLNAPTQEAVSPFGGEGTEGVEGTEAQIDFD